MRRRRPPARLWSILVIVALLWTQVVYAFHGGCSPVIEGATATVTAHHGDAALVEHATTATTAHHCDAASRRSDDPGCEVHCATQTSSSDVTRVPPVPALLPVPAEFVLALVHAPRASAAWTRVGHPPGFRPRGPIGHPAALLLI